MASRRGIITWTEMEIPAAPTNRRAIVSWTEMEVPSLPRRAIVSWTEMEIPDVGLSAPSTDYIGGFQSASEAVAGLALVEENPQTHPYLQALSQSLKQIAAQGEPVSVAASGTTGTLPKFANSTRLTNSAIVEVPGSPPGIVVNGTMLVTQTLRVTGEIRRETGDERIILSQHASSPVLATHVDGSTRLLLGSAAVPNDVINGVVVGDAVFRTQGGSFRFSVNSGSSLLVSMIAQGLELHPPAVYRLGGIQVLGPRKVGYAVMAGTANRASTFDTATVTTAQLAQRVKAIQEDLTAHGIIGP